VNSGEIVLGKEKDSFTLVRTCFVLSEGQTHFNASRQRGATRAATKPAARTFKSIFLNVFAFLPA
jgi:hypothetical protein